MGDGSIKKHITPKKKTPWTHPTTLNNLQELGHTNNNRYLNMKNDII
jgi:hypothetical protein